MKRPKISRRAETRPYGRVSAPTGNCRKFLTQLGRGGPQNGPRRMLHVRTASASIALSTARATLPSDPNAPLSPSNTPIRPNAPRYYPLPPGKVQPTSWYPQLTRTYIAPKPSIMRNKG